MAKQGKKSRNRRTKNLWRMTKQRGKKKREKIRINLIFSIDYSYNTFDSDNVVTKNLSCLHKYTVTPVTLCFHSLWNDNNKYHYYY